MILPKPLPPEAEQVVRRFNELYCRERERTSLNTYWLGTQTLKCPLDLWIYQEILFRKRPELIIETGTLNGGSSHFLACMCELVGSGEVLTIDIKDVPNRPQHERLTYLTGSSVAPEMIERVRDAARDRASVMVILDANHHEPFVLRELRTYGPLVTPTHYLIVEDTNINYWSDFGPGPQEAVERFLSSESGRDFRVDEEAEKFLMTFNPGGYLIREQRRT